MSERRQVPSVSVTYAQNGSSTKSNELGMRPMQERAYEKRGEQYLLIKSPPASGKSRALMFIALDKLHNQGLRQAIIVVPEKSIGSSFADEPLSRFGFWADWTVAPKWNLCNSPGTDGGKVNSVGAFLESDDRVLVCTHATFRFAVDRFGIEAFDHRLIAVDEFHHVSANPDNKLGTHLGAFITRDKVHIVAMTGSYFRGDAEAVLNPHDEARFDRVKYTYYEQLNGYTYLKSLDIGYFFYAGSYADDILKVLDPDEKTILHIPNVNSRESTKDKHREVEHIIDALGDWQGTDPATGFQLVKRADGKVLRIADLVDDDGPKRDRVSAVKEELDPGMSDRFEALRAYLMALGDDVQETTLRFYIAFKRIKNFACVEFRPSTSKILLFVKVDPASIDLEEGFTRDVSKVGHFGTGDLEITLSSASDLERAMPLIERSYEAS